LEDILKVKFWGVRGSIPTPISSQEIENKIREALVNAKPENIGNIENANKYLDNMEFYKKGTYGGNTSCIQIFPNSGDIVFVDAGSGLRVAQGPLFAGPCGKGQGEVNLFLSHTHWDHICGFPFFGPDFIPGNKIKFYSCKEDILERMNYQQDFRFFPVPFEAPFKAKKEAVILKEYQEYKLGSMTVIPKLLYHPGDSYAYKFIDDDGKTIIYASDSEFGSQGIDLILECSKFFEGADVLIFDTQYTFKDTTDKLDWGHSSINTGIDFASEIDVKKLVLFHHEPTYNDKTIFEIKEHGNQYKNHLNADNLELVIAYEGLEIEI
jgi:phosphoribosyl 1,2-cyclic phosphodiesterase